MNKTLSMSMFFVTIFLFCVSVVAQPTYTENELVSSAPLAWQSQYDPASRMLIGMDDGNIFAFSHTTDWASAIRYGGSSGLEGLLQDFTISSEGAPSAFGLAPSGCQVTNEPSMLNCIRVRWEPFYFNGQLTAMRAVLAFKTFTVAHLEHDIAVGDSFSVERVGNDVVNFYRSTGIPHERRRVWSHQSPYFDSDPTTVFEARTAFEPNTNSRKMSGGQEIYYCCL